MPQTNVGSIRIDDIYSMEIDERNFILRKKIITAQNSIRYETIGYFATMDNLLKKLLRDNVYESLPVTTDLQGLREIILNSHQYIEKVCSGLKI